MKKTFQALKCWSVSQETWKLHDAFLTKNKHFFRLSGSATMSDRTTSFLKMPGNQCCGFGMFIPDLGSEFFPSRIPDPNSFHPGSRFRIKEFMYFNPKKWFLSSRKYYLGCSSRIRIPDTDPDFFTHSGIPDPGVKKTQDPGSRTPDLDPQHCWEQYIISVYLFHFTKCCCQFFL